MECDTQKKLVMEAQNGSSYALSQLLQLNYDVVYKYFLKVTLDSQLAADITQDCMVRVIHKINSYDPEKSSFSTWMIAIARNLWFDEYRRRKRCVPVDYEQADCFTDPIDELIQKDELLSALRNLSEKLRVPVIMKHAMGYQYEEISRALHIPVGTVKSRISNGLKILKKELKQDE